MRTFLTRSIKSLLLAITSSASSIARVKKSILATTVCAACVGGGAFAAPHYITDLVEDYNGTSFSTAVSLPYCVMRTSGGGTQNAAILAGGYSNTDTTSDQTYEWNGVSFSQTANLGTGRCTGDIADGSQSSFQVSSGGSFSSTTCKKTEQYTTTGIGCHCIGGV